MGGGDSLEHLRASLRTRFAHRVEMTHAYEPSGRKDAAGWLAEAPVVPVPSQWKWPKTCLGDSVFHVVVTEGNDICSVTSTKRTIPKRGVVEGPGP